MSEVGVVQDHPEQVDVSQVASVRPDPRQWKRYSREHLVQERQCEDWLAAQTTALAACKRSELTLQSQIQSLLKDKQANLERIKKTQETWRALKEDIRKKTEEITREKSQLRYRDEARLNQAVKNLEDQLRLTNFSLRDENKIIAEINALKRSRKNIGIYNALEKEARGLRDQEKKVKREVDMYIQQAKTNNARESVMKASSLKNIKRQEELQRELGTLREDLSTMRLAYEKQKEAHQQYLEEQRKVRPPTPPPQLSPVLQTQSECITQTDKETQMISTLLVYLSKFVRRDHNVESAAPKPELPSPEPVEGMYVLKKEEDDVLFEGVKKQRKEKKRTNSMMKRMSHSSEVFQQFASLGMTAPATLHDAEKCMQLLTQKKHDLLLASEGGVHLSKLNISSDMAPASLTDGDSIMTTPEILLERHPGFSPQRRHSHDSGLYDEEFNPVRTDSTETLGDDNATDGKGNRPQEKVENHDGNGDCQQEKSADTVEKTDADGEVENSDEEEHDGSSQQETSAENPNEGAETGENTAAEEKIVESSDEPKSQNTDEETEVGENVQNSDTQKTAGVAEEEEGQQKTVKGEEDEASVNGNQEENVSETCDAVSAHESKEN